MSIIPSIEKSTNIALCAAKQLTETPCRSFIDTCARLIAEAYLKEQKVIIAGNGGSLTDAMHFAEELTGQFRKKRKALPAIALSDPSHITCVGNDMGFDDVFSRGVEAFGKEGDVFIALTTSGNSQNISNAIFAAKKRGMRVIVLSGKGGGKVKGMGDVEWMPSDITTSDRIQELHMAVLHIIIECVEYLLFPEE